MKKILLALFILLGSMCASAQLVKGEKSLGVKLGYVSENSSAVGSFAFQYNPNSHLRIAPEIGMRVPSPRPRCAAHRPQPALPVQPVAGRQCAAVSAGRPQLQLSWTGHHKSEIDNADVSTHVNRLGVNPGAGFDLRCSESLKLSLEAKYTPW